MFKIILKWIWFIDVASELHDKWQGNRRSSISKEDVNAARWKQLKTILQSGKHKVLFNLLQSKLFCVQSPAVLFTLFGPLSVYRSSFDFTRLYNIPISQYNRICWFMLLCSIIVLIVIFSSSGPSEMCGRDRLLIHIS